MNVKRPFNCFMAQWKVVDLFIWPDVMASVCHNGKGILTPFKDVTTINLAPSFSYFHHACFFMPANSTHCTKVIPLHPSTGPLTQRVPSGKTIARNTSLWVFVHPKTWATWFSLGWAMSNRTPLMKPLTKGTGHLLNEMAAAYNERLSPVSHARCSRQAKKPEMQKVALFNIADILLSSFPCTFCDSHKVVRLWRWSQTTAIASAVATTPLWHWSTLSSSSRRKWPSIAHCSGVMPIPECNWASPPNQSTRAWSPVLSTCGSMFWSNGDANALLSNRTAWSKSSAQASAIAKSKATSWSTNANCWSSLVLSNSKILCMTCMNIQKMIMSHTRCLSERAHVLLVPVLIQVLSASRIIQKKWAVCEIFSDVQKCNNWANQTCCLTQQQTCGKQRPIFWIRADQLVIAASSMNLWRERPQYYAPLFTLIPSSQPTSLQQRLPLPSSLQQQAHSPLFAQHHHSKIDTTHNHHQQHSDENKLNRYKER